MKRILLFLILFSSFISLPAMEAPQPALSQNDFEEALQMFEKNEALQNLKTLFKDPDFEWLKKLTNNGTDFNIKDKDGNPLLISSFRYWNSSPAILQMLIDAGADVNATDDGGRTPLMKSLYDEETFKKLINAKADVNKKDNNGNTALMLIAGEQLSDGKGLRLTNMLINAGAQIDAQNDKGETALLRAIKANNDDIIFALLDRNANLRIEDSAGHTAWQYAIANNNIAALQRMLDTNLDVNTQNKGGLTPIRQALFNNKIEIINMLLDRSASLTMEDNNKKNAWYDVIEGNKPILLKLLLASGLDINTRNSAGETPLIVAVRWHRPDIISTLLNQKIKPNLNIENRIHYTAWFYAIWLNDLPALQMMMSAGLDVNTKNSWGITPLMWAASRGKLAIVQFLLGQGADVRIVNNDNEKKTALQFAINAGHQAVANVLRDYQNKRIL